MPSRKPRPPTPLPPNVIRLADHRPTPPVSAEKARLLRLMTELRDDLRANPQPPAGRRRKYDVSARKQALIDAAAALLAEAAWLREVHQ